jgi:colanic acid/amylovoran biosynthesis glycosyltransferase
MLEAMASGLPVFATRHGGIPEAIEDGISGVLVDERDHAALAQRLLEWVRQPEGLSKIACAGSKTVAQKFEQSEQTHRLEEIYFEALSRKAGRNTS